MHSSSKNWTISNVRLVCQIKPTNYTGSFKASDSLLTRIWYTGAYTVKLNLLPHQFGSILVDRGDRISWTGDAHTSQKTAYVAFSNYDLILENIDSTSKESNGIEGYSLFWVLSVVDYFMYTGDKKMVLHYLDEVVAKLNHSLDIYHDDNVNLVFIGGDERLGSYFEEPNGVYCRQYYRMLVLHALSSYIPVLTQVDRLDLAYFYKSKYGKKPSQSTVLFFFFSKFF